MLPFVYVSHEWNSVEKGAAPGASGTEMFSVVKSSAICGPLAIMLHWYPPPSRVVETFVTLGCAEGRKKKSRKASTTALPDTALNSSEICSARSLLSPAGGSVDKSRSWSSIFTRF